MTPVVVFAFALNLSSHVKSYGAYAGFAAVIGLAVLSVLYFAQAREVKRLREWAGRGPERSAEQNARPLADPGKRVVAEPVARPEPVTPAAQSSAPPSTVTPMSAAAAGAAGAVVAGEAATEKAGDETPAGTDVKPDGDTAAATDATTTTPTETPAPTPQTGDSVAMAPVPASARLRASAVPPSARTSRTATPPANGDDDGDGGGAFTRTRVLIGVGVVVLILVIVLVATSLGGSSAKPKPNSIATTPPTPTVVTDTTTKPASTKHAPARSSITIAVLNGTTVNGQAKAIGKKLSGAGFNVPASSETNASDQTHSATIVAYAPGQQAAGLEVAKTLGLGPDAVAKIDHDTSVVAGPGMTVVVTVGSDLTR